MAYILSNKYAKNLCKRAVLVQLIIENVVTWSHVFLAKTRISYNHSYKYYVQMTLYRVFAPGPHWTPSPKILIGQCLFYASLGKFSHPPKKNFRNPPKILRDRRTRGTNSWLDWLDDTDIKFGPDMPMCVINYLITYNIN